MFSVSRLKNSTNTKTRNELKIMEWNGLIEIFFPIVFYCRSVLIDNGSECKWCVIAICDTHTQRRIHRANVYIWERNQENLEPIPTILLTDVNYHYRSSRELGEEEKKLVKPKTTHTSLKCDVFEIRESFWCSNWQFNNKRRR